MIERILVALRAATRSLRRHPSLLAGAVLTLAVSIGVNVAMLGLVDRALLSPPAALHEAERLFTFRFSADDETSAPQMSSTSYVTYRAIRDGVPALDSAAAFQRQEAAILVDGEQLSAPAMLVSANYFSTLGVRPRIGRDFDGDDDRATASPSVIVSDAFWRVRLQGDAGVLGRRLGFSGQEFTVIGVMPAGVTGHTNAKADMWMPFAAAMSASPGWDQQAFRNSTAIIARLAPGATEAAAVAQASRAAERRVSLAPLAGVDVPGGERKIAWSLLAVSGLIFVIGLANAATLLVVRGARSRHQMGLRTALGASRAILIRQVALESGLIAGVALAGALVFGFAIDDALRRILFPDLQSVIGLGGLAARAAMVAALLVSVVVAGAGMSQLPASFNTHLTSGRTDGGRRSRSLRALLIAQTSMSVILLIGAATLGSSLHQLWNQDFGIGLDDVSVVDFEPGPQQVSGQNELFARALDRVRSLPGVEAVSFIDAVPFSGFNVPPIAVPGRAEPPGAGRQLPFLTAATPDFLRILGMRVVEGRPFTEGDDRGPLIVLVNQTMARTVWPGESAIGKCIRVGFDPDFDPQAFDGSTGPPMPSDKVPCREVVGVTADVRQRSVLPFDGEDRLMQYFVPFAQMPLPPWVGDPTRVRGLLIKGKTSQADLATAVRRVVVAERTDLPFLRVRPYADLLAGQMRPWSVGVRLFGLFSTLALFVAAIGLYAAFAHSVSERRREMAIRLAVGARPRGVLRMVVREAVVLAAVGVVVGSWAAALAARAAQSLMFGASPTDPLIIGAVALGMISVSILATLLPAREAARANPAELLRSE